MFRSRMNVVLLFLIFTVTSALRLQMSVTPKNVLIIGGTRFSGLYLWKELNDRGHKITIFNRGKTAIPKLPKETEEEFENRKSQATYVKGDRTKAEDLNQLSAMPFDVVYDMNGRKMEDTKPLVDIMKGKVEHFVYMSSAGVYKKNVVMPHIEGDETDIKSRHAGKLDTEKYLIESGIPFTSIRPTYIYGPMNYNPVEEFFFARHHNGRPVCVPGHGQHVTGLGHVEDLAVAMANVIGKDVAKGKIYNVQDAQSVTFEGLAKLTAQAMGKDYRGPSPISDFSVKLYDPKAFTFPEGKKAFPMRPGHFFCGIDNACRDLEWTPKYDLLSGLKDSYEYDYKLRSDKGADFVCDDMIINDDRISAKLYDGSAEDKV